MTMSPGVDRARIEATERVIRPHLRTTPVIDIDPADVGVACARLALKLELMQHSGSFKARGAFSNLLQRSVPPAGVVAASGGNHGAAVAFAARKLGVRARIHVPTISNPEKVRRIRSFGADLVVAGDLYAEALALSQAWAAETGAIEVHAFDQDETMLGQGTLAAELERQVPDIDTVLVGVGGGGLVAGIAAWYAGRVAVIGVEPRAAPTLTRAFEAGHPVDAEAGGIAADSLAPRRVGERVFAIAKAHVARSVLVEDAAIAETQRFLWETVRIVAEPGAVAALSALRSGAYVPRPTERIAVVVSGGSTPAVDFGR
jgi:threonine dehydratase